MGEMFEELLASLSCEGQLVHVEHQLARESRMGLVVDPLSDEVWKRLGIDALWCHQAEALNLVRGGESVVVATGTASGKSLVYQTAIAEAVGSSEPASALLVFPTKALAQDQLRAIAAPGFPGLVASTYDGDTDPAARAWVRRHGNVVLTNPEMLHVGILPFHARWATFLRRLRYVVIDELHVFRGIFGTHVAHVLRRLRRVCARYGSSPTFIFTSATVGEPAALASALCGLSVRAVVDDGSPRGERLFALWNPPLVDLDSGTRGSPNVEAAVLTAALLEDGARTVTFCRSRKATEIVATSVRRQVGDALAERVRSYRGGYLPSERRDIEAELFEGQLAGVVATSALELGIDVGGLDACVIDGFPGTVASLRQQAGRAGRTTQRSLAVLVAGSDQLDQWLMTNPREVFTRPPEPAVVNLSNPFVLLPHLACAAYEAPLSLEDERWWGEDLSEGVRELVLADRLVLRNRRAVWSGRGAPAPGIGLRSGAAEEYRIADEDGRLVGTVDGARAFETVHPGAIYLHQGQTYRVISLDLDDRAAIVEAADGDEYTQVRSETSVHVLSSEAHRAIGKVRLHLGAVEVTSQVVGYDVRDARSHTSLGRHPLDLPATRLVTRAFWYTVGEDVLAAARVAPDEAPGTLHAVEHAGIGILPLFTICDRWDVGGVSTAFLGDTGHPTIVIYDGYPGGAGIAELGYGAGRRHLEATLAVVERCPCRTGCPSCVQSPKCGNGNEPLDKAGAVALLRAVLA
ncbi:MAG TPA: DEAD/DEAH box helicase [Acidimicrobiales bacterium]|nr:DEAD/DEAH box helicase [Acidimicrobiales bacterium]